VVNLLEADFVASEKSAYGDAVAVPSDATVGADEPGLEVAWIRDRFELLREG